MVEQQHKSKLLMIEGLFAVMVLIFVAAFMLDKYFPTPQVAISTGNPTVVGFVPIEIKSQPIDLYAKESTKFVVFSEKDQEFAMTSLRLSGEVIGQGRAEIVLDNGLGQELAIYSNIKSKQGNMITGMSVSEDGGQPLPEDVKVDSIPSDQAWFKITPSTDTLSEQPVAELGNDKMTFAGKFQNDCKDTCYMNMKMKKGLFYTLKIRVDAGTEVKVTELKYTLEV